MSGTKRSEETSSLQKFKMVRMKRADLKAAPWNPRKINDRQKAALKSSLSKYGLVSPIVYNETTGNIVGGHQRVHAMDCLEHTKNYYLDVAVISVTEKEEVALNIALNNQSAMGEFDLAKVSDLAEQFDLKLDDDFLFDRDDLLVSFGMDLGDSVQKRDATADEALMQSIKDRKKEVREKFKAMDSDFRDQDGGGQAVLQVVFADLKQMQATLRESGLPEDVRVVSAGDFLELPKP